MSSASFEIGSSHQLHIIGAVAFNLVFFEIYDVLYQFVTVFNTEVVRSQLNEVGRSVQLGGKESGISFDRFGVRVECRIVVSSSIEMVIFVFKPDWVFIFNIDVVVLCLRGVEFFRTGIWRLFKLRLTSR